LNIFCLDGSGTGVPNLWYAYH